MLLTLKKKSLMVNELLINLKQRILQMIMIFWLKTKNEHTVELII